MKNENVILAARKQSEQLLEVASGLTGLAGQLADISIAIDRSADKGGQGFLEQQKNLDHFRKEFDQFTQNNAAYLRGTKKAPAHKKAPQQARREPQMKQRQQKKSDGPARNKSGQFVKKNSVSK